jgi:MYXO-CTERM domain-containing protein
MRFTFHHFLGAPRLGLLAILAFQGLSRPALADNPIVQTMFTADPAPLVHNDTFYMFTGHDEDGAGWFDMREWRVFSTTDMANWTDLGVPMNLKTFTWANVDAWAAQCIFRNGKFYYYVPIRLSGDKFGIGVGISEKAEGPYTDAIGKPLLEGNSYIDPTVFLDDDGQAYMYWGNTGLWMVKLNPDMISISGSVQTVPLNKESFDNTFGEGPWLDKREGLYYLHFASKAEPAPSVRPNGSMENLRYSTSTSPSGPWKYRDMIMPAEGKSWTNHPAVAHYKGKSYFVYHNGALPGGGDGQRSVCVEEFSYGADGTIPKIPMTKTGPKQIGTLNPFQTTQAETIAFSAGLKTEKCSDTGGGMDVTSINNGDYIKVNGVNFGSGATSFDARVASGTSGGSIELHLDSQTGPLIGTCAVQGTGGAQTWATKSCAVKDATGIHDLYFKFVGTGTGTLFNFNWWKFGGPGADDNQSDGGVTDGGSADSAAATRDAGAGGTTGSADAGVGTGSGGTGGRTGASSRTGGSTGNSGAGGSLSTAGTPGRGGSSGATSALGGSGGGGATSAAGSSGSSSRSLSSGGAKADSSNSGGSQSNSTTSRGDSQGSKAESDSSGCGCRLGSQQSGGTTSLMGVLLGLLLALQRRKSRGFTVARQQVGTNEPLFGHSIPQSARPDFGQPPTRGSQIS